MLNLRFKYLTGSSMQIIRSLLRLFILITVTNFSYAETSLKDIYGQTIPLSSLKGRWVFINYWASWCHTCLEEIPELNHFYKQHQQDPITLFAVNYDALPLPEQQTLVKQFNILYPSLGEDPNQVLQLGDINAVPVTFVFNPAGKLVKTLYGGQDRVSLAKVIRKYS